MVKRKIDCIIAYDVLAEDDKATTKENYRGIYLENLEKRGLELEKAECKTGIF